MAASNRIKRARVSYGLVLDFLKFSLRIRNIGEVVGLVTQSRKSAQPTTSMPSSVASLDSTSSDDLDDDLRIAQEEWEESLEQIHQLLSIVLLPFLGKWLGRRWSYWGTWCILRSYTSPNDEMYTTQHTRAILNSGWDRSSSLGGWHEFRSMHSSVTCRVTCQTYPSLLFPFLSICSQNLLRQVS